VWRLLPRRFLLAAIVTRAAGAAMGHIVKLSRRKHYPRKHGSDCHGVLIWVKLSNNFDMGQIVIFFLLLAFFFFAWEFSAAGAKT